ncbi:MAG TPA: hypothetical protein VFS40_09620 [Gemmatimonadales bacterium]|nr:hypothetical protein [Gemmatimonadales bacterium]
MLSIDSGARRLAAASLLALGAGGCTSWQAAPAQTLAAPAPARHVAVQTTSGEVVLLVGAQVTGDSIVGGDERRARPGTPYERRAIALSDVRTVAVRRRDTFKMVTVVAAPALAALAGGFLVGY